MTQRQSRDELSQKVARAEVALLMQDRKFVRFLLRFAIRAGIFHANYQTDGRAFRTEGRRALGLETLDEIAGALAEAGGPGIYSLLEREGALMQARAAPDPDTPDEEADEHP